MLKIFRSFYSIQRSGIYAGCPTVFLEFRSAAPGTEFKIPGSWLGFLKAGAHLVFTGDDPMTHQKEICKWLYDFEDEHGFHPKIGVETSGAFRPNQYLCAVVNNWNIERGRKASLQNTFYEGPVVMGNVHYNYDVETQQDVIGIFSANAMLLERISFTPTPAASITDIAEACMMFSVRFNFPIVMIPTQFSDDETHA